MSKRARCMLGAYVWLREVSRDYNLSGDDARCGVGCSRGQVTALAR